MVVVWSERAENRLRNIYKYYFEIAGLRTARKIVNTIIDASDRLASHPNMGPVERYLGRMSLTYRSIVVHKNYKLLYRVEDQVIHILSIFDCRQHPGRMREDMEEDLSHGMLHEDFVGW
ncbi:type II toxin-antitoxin system RelE/ParE family toxin [Bacteroides sp. 51]|uniref:type II toxin-antitoxin system RelE/ParE family toxin n=1 Tax=Bacteroides sp. 51 TaxID=2302938 RepID=UPI0013D1C32A|nr:type II toxin-antitoxin system RelE/ParE family toxin [Bacteroides sp. 51]